MSSPTRSRRMRIQREAEGYLELGLPRRALEALTRIGKATDYSAHALFLQGEALRSLKRYDEAIDPLARAADVDPENIHVWLALGWCHKRTGRIDLAIESLEQALAADPSEALIHYNLACYWCVAGNKSRTLGYLGQALAMSPAYGQLVEEEPDFDRLRADPDFRELVEGQPVGD